MSLGDVEESLARVENTIDHLPARDCHRLAASWIEQASTATIRKYRPRSRGQPSQSWRTFLQNHAGGIAAMDFSVVPTVTAPLLYVLVVMNHERRKIVHFNITDSPTAAWTAQQIINAFPYDTAPEYLLRDRDPIYGSIFVQRVVGMGIKQTLISPRSPWQSPYVERLIGSIRRECLDGVIVFQWQTTGVRCVTIGGFFPKETSDEIENE